MAPSVELPTGRASSQWLAGFAYHIRWFWAVIVILRKATDNTNVVSLFRIVLGNICKDTVFVKKDKDISPFFIILIAKGFAYQHNYMTTFRRIPQEMYIVAN